MKKRDKNREIDLRQGSILKALTKLALPITAAAFVRMAYNFVDMLFIGRLGEGPMAAVGTAGMYLWLSEGILMFSRMGGQVLTGQRLGADDREGVRQTATSSFQLTFILGLVYSIILILGRKPLIGFFNLENASTIQQAETYLTITAIGIVFAFVSGMSNSLITAAGNSMLPFKITTIGLVINMALDPILIFGWGPIPALGVAGAAWATMTAMAIESIMLTTAVLRRPLFKNLPLLNFDGFTDRARPIIRLGVPTALQQMGFTGISMIIARLVAGFGESAIAAQKVGSQVEAISWMTADGFANALRAFISQNYGAGLYDRARNGFRKAFILMTLIGVANTAILYFLAEPLFGIFLDEAGVLFEGTRYLQILAVSQVFMCMEIIVAAAFNGFGETVIPSTVLLVGTVARIPMAYGLSSTALGVTGIWWAITLSSVFKGIIIYLIFRSYEKKKLHPGSGMTAN